MSKSGTYKSALLMCSAVMLVAPAAFAQTVATTPIVDETQEVVVMAKRQPYRGDVPLKNVPQSVQVIDGQLLQDVGITRLDKALDMVSGIARQSNFGGLWDSFAIRGFVGDPNLPSGYLVNGYNEGRGYGGPRDASNTDHIEVLKGPGSALFGRGEPGGTVNIITKKPRFYQEGYLAASIGDYSMHRVEGDYTNRITSSIAGRISAAYEEGDSFRDTVHTKKYTITPSFIFKISDKAVLSYDINVVHQEVPFDRGILALNGNLETIPINRFLGEPGDGPIKTDVVGNQFQYAYAFNKDWNLIMGLGYRETTFKGTSTEPELAVGRQKLYIDGTNVSRIRRARDYKTKSLLPRAELSGRFQTGSFTHHILIGGDYEDLEYDNSAFRYRPGTASAAQTEAAANSVNIYNPVYGKLPAMTAHYLSSLEEDKASGIYVQDQIDLTKKLKFRLGARYDNFEQTYTNRLTSVVIKQSLTATSPSIGLVYEASPALSFYTSYAAGFRPQTGADYNNQPFTPEESKSAEVGMKAEAFDKRLTGTLAIYKTTKSNILTADPIPEHAGYSVSVGEAESKGLDLDIKAILPAGVNLILSYAYTDAYVTEGLLDPDFGKVVSAGDPLINIPKNSGNLMVWRDFTFDGNKFTLGGSVNYVDKRLGETGSSFYLPDYTLVGLFGSYQATEHVKITAEVSNLFDETYYSASYSALWIFPGAPRTSMIRVGYTF